MKFVLSQVIVALMLVWAAGCGGNTTAQDQEQAASAKTTTSKTAGAAEEKNVELATATFGGGCFWCVESVFLRLEGVESVKSGYMGGHVDNPTYKQVCTGLTGHAEVIEVNYDPKKVALEDLLAIFFETHDPTTLNRQGNDVGTQYRSAVFFHDDQQRQIAEGCIEKLNAAKRFPSPIVTEVSAVSKMYYAEDYHQDYFNKNPGDGYCNFAVPSKIAKLKKLFGDKLKDEYKGK